MTEINFPENILHDIARICHEANKALCEAFGDDSQVPWDEAPNWQKDSAIKGVNFALNNPEAHASAQHEAWCEHKISDGWTYSDVKDPKEKTHPCLVPFEQLPQHQQAKDKIFKAIVNSFVNSLGIKVKSFKA